MGDKRLSGKCSLCGRIPKRGTTEHHLIPKQCHSNKWFKKRHDRETLDTTISLCRDCHKAIHRIVPRHKDLARHYNTREKLLAHVEIHAFVAWVRKRK